MTYFTAFYWSTVTCTTVGYGDITPVNKFEKALIVVIIILGCSYFSWILSQLASRFKDLANGNDANIEKLETIKKICE